MAQRSLDLIEAMYAVGEAAQPITGRHRIRDDVARRHREIVAHKSHTYGEEVQPNTEPKR